MRLNRRDLLTSGIIGGPAAFFGLNFAEILAAQNQSQAQAPVDSDVVNFWVHGMGVPANTVIGAERTRGRQPSGPSTSDFGREPLFLHHDPKAGLITTDQITPDKLLTAADTEVTFQLVRMRLNQADDATFRSYSSGGIYVDLQQGTSPAATASTAPSMASDFESTASSLFSAIFPATKMGKEVTAKAAKSGGSKGSAGQPQASPAAKAAGAGTASVPLQQAKQAQSITLPGGIGRTSFACFAKDKRKTLFGQFVDVFGQLASSPMLSYLPMLSLPAVGLSTLNAVRSLVANLQAHGENQQWIMMSPPTDLVTTQSAAQTNPDALRLPAGNYVVIPKQNSDAMKAVPMDNLKILDGFLVPKTATALDVYDAYQSTAPGVSYITISVGVQPSKKSAAGGRPGGK
jgi:hypothetical protein